MCDLDQFRGKRALTFDQFVAEVKKTLPWLNSRRDRVTVVSLGTEHCASVRGVSIRNYHGQWAVENRCGVDLASALQAALAYHSKTYGDDWYTTVAIRKLMTPRNRKDRVPVLRVRRDGSVEVDEP